MYGDGYSVPSGFRDQGMTYHQGRAADRGSSLYVAHSNTVDVVGMYNLPMPLGPRVEGRHNDINIDACLQPQFPGSKLQM